MTTSPATSPSPEPAAPTVGLRWQRPPLLALSLGSAILLWLTFPPTDSGPLAWVALVPLIALIDSDRPRWQVYLSAWAGGLLFWHLAISWVCLAAPTAWTGWTVMASFLSLGWLLLVALARLGRKRLRLPLLLVVPVAILVEEYYRAYVLIGFPWYYLAHTQYRFLPLIQVADLAGVWGVTLLVAAGNVALYDLLGLLAGACPFPARKAAVVRIASVLVLLLGSLLYGGLRLASARFAPGPMLALLQSDIPQELKSSNTAEQVMAEYGRLAAQAVEAGPDLIVWPETSYPRGFPEIDPALDDTQLDALARRLNPNGSAAHWRNIAEWVQYELREPVNQVGIPMVVGVTTYDFRPGRVRKFNSAVLLEPGKPTAARYDKLHLVPFGEFVPLIQTLPFMTQLTPYDPGHVPNLERGDAPAWFDLNGVRYATAICFEDTVPHVVRRSFTEMPDRRPPDILLNLSNDGWFRGSSELRMHLVASVFRAVENRVPLARAVNTGSSSVIDGNGRIIAALPDSTSRVLAAEVPLDPRSAPYSRLGDWLPRLALTLAIAGIALSAWRARRPATPNPNA